jgi:glycosyltransferase involved in cell wall biosynthesis
MPNILVISGKRSREVVDPIKTTEFDHTLLEVSSEKGAVANLFLIFVKCIKIIWIEKIDIVLLNAHDTPGIAGMVAAKITGTPVIIRLVGDRYGAEKLDRLATELERKNVRKYVQYLFSYWISYPLVELSDQVVVISKQLKEDIITTSTHSDKTVTVAELPVKSEYISGKKKLYSDNLTLLTVTNLDYLGKYRGVVKTIKDIRPILDKNNGIEFVVAGGGIHFEKLSNYVDRLPYTIRENINLLGQVDNIEQQHDDADIFVYISYLEGYSNAVLEARGLGTPIIVNSSQAQSEQITHFQSGLIVNAKNNGEIRSAVELLHRNETLREKLIDNALTSVLEENSPEAIGTKLSNVFKKNS